MMKLTKVRALSLASLVIAGMSLTASAPASANDGRNAALIVGGLAAGALVGGAIASQNHGYGYGYAPASSYYGGYYGEEDVYDAPVVVRHCYRERRAIYDYWGNFAGYRRVRVCD